MRNGRTDRRTDGQTDGKSDIQRWVPHLKIYSQQEHAIRIVYSKDRFSYTRELFKECKVLNVYQVNIWKNLVFMHQINSNIVSTIFLNKFKNPTHDYPTNFARTNYSIPPFKLINSK